MTEDTRKRGFFSRMFGRDKPEPAPPEAAPKVPETPADAVAPTHPAPANEPSSAMADRAVPAAAAADDARPGIAAEVEAATAPDETVATAVVDDPRPVPEPEPDTGASAKKGGWFQRLKAGLTRTSTKLSEGITGLFTKRKLDAETLDDLEDLLIQADLGVAMAQRMREALGKGRHDKMIAPEEVRQILAREVAAVLEPIARPLPEPGAHRPHVILVVGVNGTGKTTTIGKIAHRYRQQGKTVMLAAGDTFRAAAIEQLKIWGERTKSPVMARETGSDASGLAFDAMKAAREQECDVLLIDTAGRLQNKAGLMQELEKVIRVIKKVDPEAPHDVVLVLDATTGQNALSQVDVFKDKAGVTGLVMTKLDGTARGGILVAIAERFAIPVYAIGVGEGIDDLQPFDPDEFARAIAQP